MFGVNPWTLMTWMGHMTITETMRYVHVAIAHRRPARLTTRHDALFGQVRAAVLGSSLPPCHPPTRPRFDATRSSSS